MKSESRPTGAAANLDPFCNAIQFGQAICKRHGRPSRHVLVALVHNDEELGLIRHGRRVIVRSVAARIFGRLGAYCKPNTLRPARGILLQG
jgi:hypothetical protein